ncbi:MAG: LemA family protein [Defluviitaleaceae bacterium]|nr:LemA family protein [Defluviitaleaceae bacterium]
MSLLTIFFVLIIAVCTMLIVLFNSVAIKLGRLESSQKELEVALIKDTESVEDARAGYDAAVAAYNTSISQFPGMIIAGIFGFEAIGDDDF